MSETKFALHAQNKRNSGISGELGEFCTEYEVSRFLLGEFCIEMRPLALCWASFFAEVPVLGPCWASFFADWHCAQVLEATRHPPRR